jgi:hypothetical protein
MTTLEDRERDAVDKIDARTDTVVQQNALGVEQAIQQALQAQLFRILQRPGDAGDRARAVDLLVRCSTVRHKMSGSTVDAAGLAQTESALRALVAPDRPSQMDLRDLLTSVRERFVEYVEQLQ